MKHFMKTLPDSGSYGGHFVTFKKTNDTVRYYNVGGKDTKCIIDTGIISDFIYSKNAYAHCVIFIYED